MRLYLLRHGIAVPHGTPDIADDDRPLTPKGERRVRQVAYGWKTLRPDLDRIVTSPLPRAHRTAEIFARVLGDPDLLEISENLKADQTAEVISSWLKTRDEENLMLVGHNPHLSELVGLLTTGRSTPIVCELRRAGIAALSSTETGMQIDWIVRPRVIRRLVDR
jgi:phosphohistidine phosphatase